MNRNKDILKYCPNYYTIINFDFKDNDIVSDKLIKVYKSYIFSIDEKSEVRQCFSKLH